MNPQRRRDARWPVARALLAALAAASCARAGAAHAQSRAGGGPIALDGSACQSLEVDEVAGLVALEVAPRPVLIEGAATAATTAPTTHVSFSCDAKHAVLHVRERAQAGADRAPLTLDLQLAATPDNARARLVALTLAELIATAHLEGRARATPAEASDGTSDDERPEEATGASNPAQVRGALVWLGAGAGLQGEPTLVSPELRAGGLLPLPSAHLALTAELAAQRGERTLGASTVQLTGGSTGLALAAQLPLDALDLLVSLGLRAGYVRLTGRSNEPGVGGSQLDGLWFGPALGAAVHVPLSPRWALRGALDMDYVARPLQGMDQHDARLFALEGIRATAMLALIVGLR